VCRDRRQGCEVVLNGRDAATLAATADEIERQCGRRPHAAVADLNTPDGRAALLAACAEPDILVTNNAGPAPGTPGALSTPHTSGGRGW